MNGQRTIVVLLAVCAVLLGLNLVKGSPLAVGQQAEPTAPTPISIAATERHVFRLWSNGTVDCVRYFSSPNATQSNGNANGQPSIIIPGL